ncbi:MAG: DNA topoisomerase 3 [Oscillospiraceae bacterium]|jgi:DNA topoisomerase-3|nr:DNA topoisomerase 3 [Oscillospiraceae bacterium]
MKLVIAEKPSVALSIASVIGANTKQDGYMEGNGYLVSWCYGHLVELADAAAYNERYAKWVKDDLPILPELWQYAVTRDKKKQFDILAGLMKDKRVQSLVCATDAGREGELIFRLVYEKAGCKKPFERLWISSMEDKAIKDGFDRLKPGADYDNLYASALCRSQADWLVGINATRLFSVLYGAVLTVGRVQSPTLAMLTERAAQIAGFKKEKYYKVHINPGDTDAVSENIKTKAEADKLRAACDKQQAVCRSVKTEKKTVNPPRLFDLTALQREANKIYGYTAQQTLDYAQSLYEKKLITYPRTDSQYLTADMGDTAAKVIALVKEKILFGERSDFTPDILRVTDDKKVSDHHAIIPTAELMKTSVEAIPEAEGNILCLIAARLLCATAAPHVYEAVTAEFDCAKNVFTAKGRTVISDGWKSIDASFRNGLKNKPDSEEKEGEKTLPLLTEGQIFDSVDAAVSEHTTTPPKAYTEDTLLAAMERAGNEDTDADAERRGLGTPATRAGIIEKLVQKGFVKREKRQLIPTDKGINLIKVLPENLTSPKLTAEWENALTEIAKGKTAAPEFMAGIAALTRSLVQDNATPADNLKELFAPARKPLGVCPRCGTNVYEGKRNFYCGNRECRFVMWKDDRFFTSKGKTLTAELAGKLLKDGKAAVKGLTSKAGKPYDAVVLLADTGEKYVNFKLDFPDKKDG